MFWVKYMRNGYVHGLVKVSALQWWHTSSHDFIHQKQVACYDRTKKKKKEINYIIQMLYTVTIKQKEHINWRQRKKCPDDISTSIDRRKHFILATTNFNYANNFISITCIWYQSVMACTHAVWNLHTRFVPKVSVLIFYLNVYWTHLKLQVISFKVWPLGSYTVVPTFSQLIIAVPEVIFCKCV